MPVGEKSKSPQLLIKLLKLSSGYLLTETFWFHRFDVAIVFPASYQLIDRLFQQEILSFRIKPSKQGSEL